MTEKKILISALRSPPALAVAVIGALLTLFVWMGASRYAHKQMLSNFNNRVVPLLALGGGLVTTFLLYLLTVLLVAARLRAEAQTLDIERANTTLARKEEEIRSVVDYLVDCVIAIDVKGIVRSVNPAVGKVFGWTAAEVIGQNVSMLMPKPDRTAHKGYIEHYLRTGEPHIIGIGRTVEGLHKNGELIALDLSVNEYFVQRQRYFTGILRDVRSTISAPGILHWPSCATFPSTNSR